MHEGQTGMQTIVFKDGVSGDHYFIFYFIFIFFNSLTTVL